MDQKAREYNIAQLQQQMSISEYSQRARATAIYPDVGANVGYALFGLMGESGELADHVKKMMRNDDGGALRDIKPIVWLSLLQWSGKVDLETHPNPEQYKEMAAMLKVKPEELASLPENQRIQVGLDWWASKARAAIGERGRAILLEAGDLLWYINAMALEVNYSLLDVVLASFRHHQIADRVEAVSYEEPPRHDDYIKRCEPSDGLLGLLAPDLTFNQTERVNEKRPQHRPGAMTRRMACYQPWHPVCPASANKTAQHICMANLLLVDMQRGLSFLLNRDVLRALVRHAVSSEVFEMERGYVLRALVTIYTDLTDFLWCCGYSVQEAAEASIAKLESRKERGVLQGSGSNR